MNLEKLEGPESQEGEPSKTDRILAVLDEMPFSQGGRAGDLTNWHQISDSLREKNFSSVEDFRNAVSEAIKNKNWIAKKAPETILAYVDDVLELINAWQEKKE
ncbi:MAG: hypothetical protein A3D65_05255 [Candidatus Lloydbacteria bacterium RIFCSPHIGHO2_02_FULL_50_13]|uniref:Uncharacterized protein n=1 Tax=Candidatus Lloydbacteria bacterium RIFCSPHIGHO2_02_FULL_50_13 TaxID=1798661 RepID=A0A1G2D7Z2_9BACT|nr:MAG: hypothetical protein A3D65_05255 [Candidatus Lloydbacteria bacterium RIFCSPHIGHO2_02_FULL_50_13]